MLVFQSNYKFILKKKPFPMYTYIDYVKYYVLLDA